MDITTIIVPGTACVIVAESTCVTAQEWLYSLKITCGQYC